MNSWKVTVDRYKSARNLTSDHYSKILLQMFLVRNKVRSMLGGETVTFDICL